MEFNDTSYKLIVKHNDLKDRRDLKVNNNDSNDVYDVVKCIKVYIDRPKISYKDNLKMTCKCKNATEFTL